MEVWKYGSKDSDSDSADIHHHRLSNLTSTDLILKHHIYIMYMYVQS